MGMVAFEPDLDHTNLSASQAHFPPSGNAEVRTPLIADFLATPPVSTPPVAASPIGASNVPLHQTPLAPIQNTTFTSAFLIFLLSDNTLLLSIHQQKV